MILSEDRASQVEPAILQTISGLPSTSVVSVVLTIL